MNMSGWCVSYLRSEAPNVYTTDDLQKCAIVQPLKC
jgi:hypothetical protein